LVKCKHIYLPCDNSLRFVVLDLVGLKDVLKKKKSICLIFLSF